MDFKKQLAELIQTATSGADEIEAHMIESPPTPDMGDFAFPCFRLSKSMRKAPPMIAKEIAEKIERPDFISEIKVLSGYVNFFLKKDVFAEEILRDVLKKGAEYGRTNVGLGGAVTMDYSSPNIAKPFHIGHLRTTVIGQALYNIHNFLGYKSIGINHLGDWGTQFGKLIVAYKAWGSKDEIETGGIPALNRLYVRFHEEAENNDALNEEARNYLVKMQDGDEEALSIWKWFVDISLKEFERVYKILNVKFDYFTGESFYNDKMDKVVDELNEKGMTKLSEGATIVDLEDAGLPPCLILRSDGGTLYHTRDLAAVFYRKNTYNFVKSLYIVGLEQSMHFTQLFKVVELMGYDWAKNMYHIPFGLVNLESGKLSTRKGNVILLEDLLLEAIKRTKDIIEEKNPTLENKDEVAAQVGIGAIIFNDLYNGRIKDVTFSFERVLSFEGETGPYVQYTHARASSVLSKAGVENAESARFKNIDFKHLGDDASFECVKILSIFADKVIESANKFEPSVVTRYTMDLAQAFNKFYHENVILTDDEDVKTARLALVLAVKTVLKSALSLIGMGAPEKM